MNQETIWKLSLFCKLANDTKSDLNYFLVKFLVKSNLPL